MRAVLISAILVSTLVIVYGDRCYSQRDCKDGFCCTGGITPYLKGECKLLGQEGELCDSNEPVTAKYFLYCPCVEGLTCTHIGDKNVISMNSPICKP